MNNRIERCFVCDDPTGRAGIAEDSLYDEAGVGPFCESCWEKHRPPSQSMSQDAPAVVRDPSTASGGVTDAAIYKSIHAYSKWAREREASPFVYFGGMRAAITAALAAQDNNT